MKNNIAKYYILTFYLCSTFVAFAQPGTNDNSSGLESGDPPAPIGDYLWVLALVGILFVFFTFKAIHNKKIQD